ncbi:MAG: phospho-N-acetylmuramoyl-pentapeptide-transferase, partial [Ruminococcus sp.]|nr:phospho-N-acetylmuramoyl-pentapeptide-transferase [Ruminococcus sp.]
LAIVFMRSQAPLPFIPFALVIILDGGLGLLKVSCIRFLKMNGFMKNIRTPLHDHARKNKGWSDTQVVMRFSLVQILCSTLYLSFIR